MNRRRFLCAAAGLSAIAPVLCLPAATAQSAVIKLRVRKFEFEPSEIAVRRGAPLTLAIFASDFAHGFSIPDFAVRVDLIPGKTVEVSLQPQRTGRHYFLCDNFCGEGHDQMTGVLVVSAD